MIDITPIINALILLCAALVTCVLIPWLKAKLTKEQLDNLCLWVEVGVNAAEQIYKGNGRGEEKKEYVLAFLEERGYTVSFEELDALIEAYVKKLDS